MTSEEKDFIEREGNNIFSLENWLPDAAKRAGQLSMVSHPGKFSHPGAKISPIIAEAKRSEDGFLRTGNAAAEADVFGNAAAMDVYKFLSLTLDDGQTILSHLELNTKVIQNALHISSMSFDALREGFLSIKKNMTIAKTSDCVKQVYFPVGEGYHLLSILTASGLVYELRNRIQTIRFSDEIKIAREKKKKNLYCEHGYDELYDLTMIGYGGTKPQNISVLNSTYGGKAYLLPSIPPTLSEQHIRLPKSDFFSSLWLKNFHSSFIKLHKLFVTEHNNKEIRDGVDQWVQNIINSIIEKMWMLRLAEAGWSIDTNLPMHQKIWLDESRKEERDTDDNWLNNVSNDFARWFIATYEKILGKKAVTLDDTDLRYLKSMMKKNEESLI